MINPRVFVLCKWKNGVAIYWDGENYRRSQQGWQILVELSSGVWGVEQMRLDSGERSTLETNI